MHVNVPTILLGLWAAQEAVAIYTMPTVIALARKLPNRGHIAVINGYLGWTVAGWIYALVRALRTDPATPPTAGTEPVGSEARKPASRGRR